MSASSAEAAPNVVTGEKPVTLERAESPEPRRQDASVSGSDYEAEDRSSVHKSALDDLAAYGAHGGTQRLFDVIRQGLLDPTIESSYKAVEEFYLSYRKSVSGDWSRARPMEFLTPMKYDQIQSLAPGVGLMLPSDVEDEDVQSLMKFREAFHQLDDDVWQRTKNKMMRNGTAVLFEPATVGQYPVAKFEPRFVPPYKTAITAVESMTPASYGYNISASLLNDVVAWSKHYCLTNGGVVGFMTRFNVCNEMADRCLQLYPVEQRVTGLYDRLQATVKCSRTSNPVPFTIVSAEPANYVRVNPKSQAGPSWECSGQRRATRDSVRASDAFSAFMQEVMFRGDGWQGKFTSVGEAIHAYYLANSIAFAKPKFEVIKVADLQRKIRKITVGDSSNQVLLGAVCTAFTKSLHTFNNTTNYEDNGGSLYGFNPFYRSMHRFISEMRENREPRLFRYSDNLFYFDGTRFLGFDVAKMESSSTIQEAEVIMDFINDTVDSSQSDPIGAMMTRVQGSVLCHDNVVIRSNWCMLAKGLSSGSQNTFLINDMRMASAVFELRRMLDDGLGQRFHEAFKAKKALNTEGYIVPFVLEPTACDDDSGVYTGFRVRDEPAGLNYQPPFVTLATYFSNKAVADLPHGTLTEFGYIILLDILGWDATAVMFEGELIFCSCLSYHRVWKIALFRKSETNDFRNADPRVHSKKNALDQIIDHAINYFTTLTAIWVGGYAYSYIHVLLYQMSRVVGMNLIMRVISYSGDDLKVTLERLVDEYVALLGNSLSLGGEDEWDAATVDSFDSRLSGPSFMNKVTGLLRPVVDLLMSSKNEEEKLEELTSKATRAFALTFLHLPEQARRSRSRGNRAENTGRYELELI